LAPFGWSLAVAEPSHYSVNILHYSGQYKETFNVWDGGAKRAKNVRTNP
jgi:hypothetical protein